jgi:hypothetical protein
LWIAAGGGADFTPLYAAEEAGADLGEDEDEHAASDAAASAAAVSAMIFLATAGLLRIVNHGRLSPLVDKL